MAFNLSTIFNPEYRTGFRMLKKEIGLWPTIKVAIPSVLELLRINYKAGDNADKDGIKKTKIKNHFNLLALMYGKLCKRYGTWRTKEIMYTVLMEGGQVFFQGFTPLGPGSDLTDFVRIYKDFESRNIVFDVIEESNLKFEIVIKRCLIYEAFKELGMGDITIWMCDVASAYFKNYHPKILYVKDRMIARGDNTCHEIFTWQD